MHYNLIVYSLICYFVLLPQLFKCLKKKCNLLVVYAFIYLYSNCIFWRLKRLCVCVIISQNFFKLPQIMRSLFLSCSTYVLHLQLNNCFQNKNTTISYFNISLKLSANTNNLPIKTLWLVCLFCICLCMNVYATWRGTR